MARIFISFAKEDAYARDFLVGQAKNDDTPFEFTDMSVKEPWDEKWKSNCRTKMIGCDGVIALVSKSTATADGARWEMQCAKDEKIPMLGVHIQKDNKGLIPAELIGCNIIEWTWDGIAKFIKSL